MQQLNDRGTELGLNFTSHPGAAFKDPTGVAQALDAAYTNALAGVAADNRMRDMQNQKNAAILGYDSWWSDTSSASPATPMHIRRQEMIEELESSRYFVVLMAYDFQLIVKEKKHKLLWETRFSIDVAKNAFDKQLAAMAMGASPLFGKDSNGLQHKKALTAHVDIGELKTVEEPEAK